MPGLAGTRQEAELCLPLHSGKQIPLFYSLSIVWSMSGSLLSHTRAVLPLGLGQLVLAGVSMASVFSVLFPYGAGMGQHWGSLAEKRCCVESRRNAKLSPVFIGSCSRSWHSWCPHSSARWDRAFPSWFFPLPCSSIGAGTHGQVCGGRSPWIAAERPGVRSQTVGF